MCPVFIYAIDTGRAEPCCSTLELHKIKPSLNQKYLQGHLDVLLFLPELQEKISQ